MTNPTRTRLYKVVTPLRTRLIEAGSRSSALLHAASTEILVSLPEQQEIYILAKTGVEIEHASHAALSDDERLTDIARRAHESAEKIRLHAALTQAITQIPTGIDGIHATQLFKSTHASVARRLRGGRASLKTLQSMASSLSAFYPLTQGSSA